MSVNDEAFVKEKTVRALTERMIGAVNALEFDPSMVGEATSAALSALASAGAANTARAATETARDEAMVITGLTGEDAAVAHLLGDDTSATHAAVVPRLLSDSPRGGKRAARERKPVLAVDQVWPNAIADFQIVHAEGATLYAVGPDTGLRKSTDNGASWVRKSNTGGLGMWALSGMFFKTSTGTIVATYHPFSLAAPKIVRSTDDGATWTDVVASQANVDYLGPTSICQDPNTGHLYLTEYVITDAATKPTFKITRSTDDGATWATFHTFQRDAATYPNAVRHGHAVQYDPISGRIHFLCGDGEQKAGIYRLTADGSTIEPIIVRDQLAAGVSAGAVGVMFFPDYIAWGNDQFANSGLIRMARTEIGKPDPVVEVVSTLQATSFYTARTKADNTEWLLTVSNENGAGGRLDNAMHIYRVADNGATIDEVITLPASGEGADFSWVYPVGGVVLHSDTSLWLGTNAMSPIQPFTGSYSGYQMKVRLAWGTQSAVRVDATTRKPHYTPVDASSGNVILGPLEARIFATTESPLRATRLYIMEATREVFSGTGYMLLEVGSYAPPAVNQTLGTDVALSQATDTATKAGHGLTLGVPLRFTAATGEPGIVLYQQYYVVNPTANTFQVARERNGIPVDLVADSVVTVKYDAPVSFTVLKDENGDDMSWTHRSFKAAMQSASSPWMVRADPTYPGMRVGFRLNNVSGGLNMVEGVGTVSYAWGF